MSDAAASPRLAPWFPNAPSACKAQATAFFECFTDHSMQEPGERDAHVAQRGLQACLTQMRAYDACMEKLVQNHPLQHYRVEEQYRAQQGEDDE